MNARADEQRQTPAEEALEKSIRLYREMGFSAERIANQLIRSGHPVDAVRARFPDIPATALIEPPTRGRARSGPRDRRLVDATGAPKAGSELPTSCGDLLRATPLTRALERPLAPTSVSTSQSRTSYSKVLEPELEGMSFQYVPLIQCSFPHGDPGEQTVFTRRNGWLELTLSTARPETGLPYGVPARLLTIYCTTEAIRTGSPEIDLGRSVHDFLRRLDIPISRGERGSLRVYSNQLLRLIHCALSIDENIRDSSGRQGLHIRQALFVNEARLWWDDETGIGRGSSLVLSPVLYESILERSAPLSTQAIKQLRKSPMDLDVYAWLVHRLFHLSKPSSLSWEQLSGQIGHNYGELRYFRRFFGDSLSRVMRVYPEARVSLSEKGLLLLPSKPHIEPRSSARL